ncbi:hypothetical protein ACIQWR_31320 [Streptomyces sp. NPDC098789]|uniref:hypothetical protein n=1 Tax=Streptomyces sp. NPDC098789 TaxID=3366098 RepID=UPI003817CF27
MSSLPTHGDLVGIRLGLGPAVGRLPRRLRPGDLGAALRGRSAALDYGVIEWTWRGTLRRALPGMPVPVRIIEFADDGRIRREIDYWGGSRWHR